MPGNIDKPITFTSAEYHPLDVMADETADKLIQANLFYLETNEWGTKPVFYVQLSELGSDAHEYPGQLEQKARVAERIVEGMYNELGGTGRVAAAYKRGTSIHVYECKDKTRGTLYLRTEDATKPTEQQPRLIVSVTSEKPAEFVKYEAEERRVARFKRAAKMVLDSKHHATESVGQFLGGNPKKRNIPFKW